MSLMFDCGEACLWQLPFSEVQSIDHLLFSHLHMVSVRLAVRRVEGDR
jgi:ribonuclease BN (tRNA processing enzyme)